jgi:hypothetical protein
MTLRWRSMQPKDVKECAGIIAAHPVIGPRYGSAIADLRTAWLRLLGSDTVITSVFEEVDGATATVWGVGLSIFLSDSFLREMKKPPLRWFGPELARLIARGDSPALSYDQIRKANSRDGVNAVSWEGTIRAELQHRPELGHFMMTAFLETHRGYLWKEQLAPQAESADRMRWTIHAGGRLWNAVEGRYDESLGNSLEELVQAPHIIGVTREMHLGTPGPWVGALFDYHAPRFGFSQGEQQLLEAALYIESGTDQDLARALSLSLSTIKKRWLSIYDRVADRGAESIPACTWANTGAAERGKEKRRRLLAYLREHLEELRPFARKRSPQRRAQRSSSISYR